MRPFTNGSRQKANCRYQEVAAFKTIKMGPRFLEIELTGQCSLKCRHCYGSFPSSGELPADTVETIINQARGHFDCLIFSGGEPFLHPDLNRLTRYAGQKNFSVHITTSGLSLPREKIDALSDNVILVFAVDGIGEAHDNYRGKPGYFSRLLETLAYCSPRLKEIITTLWKGNLNQLEEIIQLAEKYGAALHFNALIPVGRAKEHPEIFLSREDNERVRAFLKNLKKKSGFVFTDHYKVTEKDLQEGIDLFCKGRYSIDPQGNVHPCEFLRFLTFGNIFKQNLSDIITQAQNTPFIQAREQGFKKQVRLNLPNPFDYHTQVCHAFARQFKG